MAQETLIDRDVDIAIVDSQPTGQTSEKMDFSVEVTLQEELEPTERLNLPIEELVGLQGNRVREVSDVPVDLHPDKLLHIQVVVLLVFRLVGLIRLDTDAFVSLFLGLPGVFGFVLVFLFLFLADL